MEFSRFATLARTSSSERSIGSDEWKDLCYAQLNKSDCSALFSSSLFILSYSTRLVSLAEETCSGEKFGGKKGRVR